ncbi:complement factor H-related protein 3-like isoform X1 [Sinocyclocheilus rhinocerous]|uniref:complement factor H-related protein 3-like isoform X1 n=1 Tax=Sinocyclocheilus rhinocerous TaxID=307959 RepID=UPI0007BA97DB|nr:PREDICTED: complement factor H-related protein 3-like isoform X1 [Sinocyclocheilus rhinocerous]
MYTRRMDTKPLCAEMCAAPNIPNADIVRGQRQKYGINSRIQYKCHRGFEPEEPFEITCDYQGQWTGLREQCTVSEKCGPPPGVNDADTLEITKKEYNTGERVEYSCFNKYTLDRPFSKYFTCEQGEWRGKIRCLKPCTVTVEEMERRRIELAYADRQKMFAPHDDHIRFMCQRGKVSGGVPLRQKCNDGVVTLPECE